MVHVSVLKDHSGMFYCRALYVKPSLAFSLRTHFTPKTPGFPLCVCVGWPAWVFRDDVREGIIRDFIDRPVCDRWLTMYLTARKGWLASEPDPGNTRQRARLPA